MAGSRLKTAAHARAAHPGARAHPPGPTARDHLVGRSRVLLSPGGPRFTARDLGQLGRPQERDREGCHQGC